MAATSCKRIESPSVLHLRELRPGSPMHIQSVKSGIQDESHSNIHASLNCGIDDVSDLGVQLQPPQLPSDADCQLCRARRGTSGSFGSLGL